VEEYFWPTLVALLVALFVSHENYEIMNWVDIACSKGYCLAWIALDIGVDLLSSIVMEDSC
jgi:hypothetical protein